MGRGSTLRAIDDPDARVLAADIAHARGREDEALKTVEVTAGVRLETLGLIERITLEWREGGLFARADEPFLVEPGGTTESDVRLAPASVIRDRDGGRAVLEVDGEAFEP